MTLRHTIFGAALVFASGTIYAQNPTPPPAPPTAPDQAGPQTDNGPAIIKKKKDAPEPAPAAPDREKIKNPNGETYSLRVDVPIVSLDVNVILDKTHQFVPGLRPGNFLVLEDGVEQQVDSVRIAQTPITAVMLLEFAANSYHYIYDMHTHILTDFTNNKETIADSIRSLMIPGFSETNLFDALYETLDRTSRIEGRKYIILISSGRDTFSKLTLDKILKKVEATPNVTIFAIGTGALANELRDARGGMGPIGRMDNLQAQNQLQTFARMTGGLYFNPLFQGAMPDIFNQINDSIRNQYIITYKPSNKKNDGTYRHVKVLLVDNEGKPLKMQDEKQKPLKYSVIARDGYNAKLPVE